MCTQFDIYVYYILGRSLSDEVPPADGPFVVGVVVEFWIDVIAMDCDDDSDMEVCCVIGVASFVLGASRVIVESPTVAFDVVMPSLCVVVCVDDGVVWNDTVRVVCLSSDVVCVTDDDVCATVDSLCATGDVVCVIGDVVSVAFEAVCVTSGVVSVTDDVACVSVIVLSVDVDAIGISSNVTLDVDCDCLDVDICVNVVLVNLDVVVLGMSDGTVLVVTFSVAIAVFDICDIDLVL